MALLKRYLGWLWMLLGPVSIYFLLHAAWVNINSEATGDIANPVPWIIVIAIFTPIAVGLMVFGWYCWKAEYDDAASGETPPDGGL